jgi:DNA topoisomerase-6 subunit B
MKSAVKERKAPAPKPRRGATAEEMSARQKEVSVSEFFVKNRHLLGFDNARKALLTTVKEAVDNSLDACEEAGILPEIVVSIEDLEPRRPATVKSSRYRVTVVDNGPGIVRKQVENIFGRLLYGSKFHRLKMSRGQQGIGISAAGMNGLITTGRPMVIHTKPGVRQPAHHIELAMNTKTNRAEVTLDEESSDFPPERLKSLTAGTRQLAAEGAFLASDAFRTGTCVSIELEGKYQRGRGSVDEFLELTAIANPHARIVFVPPSRTTADEVDDLLPGTSAEAAETARSKASEPAHTTETGGVVVYPRGVGDLPPETREIQPHPKGIELGILLQMVKDYDASEGGTLYDFLQKRFCRVSAATASRFCSRIGVTARTRAGDVEPPQIETLFKAFEDERLAPPPTDCLAPIGVRQLLAGLLKGVRAEFYAASTREAAVYRGRPFQIEAAIAFGGDLAGDQSARVIRFANRVPLLFQQSACSSFKAVEETPWKNYGMQQPRGSLPVGPLIVMIHMASVWVPFTSESKEAIADYDEIRREMKLALMECGRKLGTYFRKRQKMRREGERRDVFERYIGEIAKAIQAISGDEAKPIYEALLEQARSKTAVADQQLDEDGRVVAEADLEPDDDGVIVVRDAIAPVEQAERTEVVLDAPPARSPTKAPISKSGVSKSGVSKAGASKARGGKGAGRKAAPDRAASPPEPKGPRIVTKRDIAARTEPKPKGRAKPFDDDDPRLF